jgi:hypothetical protein
MSEIATAVIDGVEYKLFANKLGPAVRVKDVDSNEVVTTINYVNSTQAQAAFNEATDTARRIS